VPICVGFGISKPEHAAEVAKAGADGVIIGSKIVGLIEENIADNDTCLKGVTSFIKNIKAAVSKS
jgi:tryptophan synthase alpha chain